jgi:polysaccharide biosynthesis/export protein
MAQRRRRKLAAGMGVLLGLCGAAGCDTLPLTGAISGHGYGVAPPLAEAPPPPLAPRSVVAWSIEGNRSQPGRVMSGQDAIGPDGRLVLGPYGSVAVNGLSLVQARVAIEQQVAKYVSNPRVTLTVLGGASQPAAQQVAAKPVVASGGVTPTSYPPVVTSSQPAAPQAPVNGTPWRPVPRGFDTAGGKVVIASTWQPIPRAAAAAEPASLNVMPGEWQLTQGQDKDKDKPAADKPMTDKPMGDKPADKPMPEPSLTGSGGAETGPAPKVATQPEPIVALLPPAAIKGHVPYGHPPTPVETAKVSLPPYIVEPPDILIVEAPGLKDQPIRGQHLVRPDGTIGIGIYGSVYVAGMTLDQIREQVAQLLTRDNRVKNVKTEDVFVDVLAYNSKFYYVITDGGGFGEQVYPFPITGNETVLDAIGKINGLPPVSSKKRIWVARRSHCHAGGRQILPVDWIAITQKGCVDANYQIMPGDRVYVHADKLIRTDSALAKALSPIERLLGVTLLGSSTVNSIKGRGAGFGSGN